MSDYSRKITPICCHAYRVNRVWDEAENRWVNRLTIEPQTFCGLKEIELKNRKIQRKNQQYVTITQSRLANKKTTTCHAYQINRCNPYRQHETSKRRQYEERVREVEHGNFSPLVFSTSGGMGASTTVAYKRLAFLLSCKWKSPYCMVMSWLRCRLGFSLLHSAIMCIRGSRSSSGHPFKGHVPASVDLALGEGRLGAV